MRIEEIDIDTFADSERYKEPRLEPRSEDLLIHGQNKVGKSITFSAIGYSLISEQWDKSVGSAARVVVTFSDGTEYEASTGGHELTTPGGRSFTLQAARDERREKIGDYCFQRYFFSPSKVTHLPLTEVDGGHVLDLVRKAVDPEKFNTLDQLRAEQTTEDERVEQLREERSEVEDRLEKLSPDIGAVEERIEQLEQVLILHEDGQLDRISEALVEYPKLRRKLQAARRDAGGDQTVEERFERLQAEHSRLRGVTPEVFGRLMRANMDVERVVADVRSEINDARKRVERRKTARDGEERLKAARRATEARLGEIDAKIEQCEELVAELEERSQSLQQEISGRVTEFQRRWTENLGEMCPSLSLRVKLDGTDGVTVAGNPDRSLHASGNSLSDAEKRLLNISFGVTLHETLGDRHPLDTFVLDEPFDCLDDKAADELLSFVTEDDERQYIFTTSDDTVVEAFPEEQRRELERDLREVTLGNFADDDEQQPA